MQIHGKYGPWKATRIHPQLSLLGSVGICVGFHYGAAGKQHHRACGTSAGLRSRWNLWDEGGPRANMRKHKISRLLISVLSQRLDLYGFINLEKGACRDMAVYNILYNTETFRSRLLPGLATGLPMWQSKHSPACWKRAHERRQGSSAVELPSCHQDTTYDNLIRYMGCQICQSTMTRMTWSQWISDSQQMSLSTCFVNVETSQGCADGAKCYAAQDNMLWPTSEIDERATADWYRSSVHCCAQDVRSFLKEL